MRLSNLLSRRHLSYVLFVVVVGLFIGFWLTKSVYLYERIQLQQRFDQYAQNYYQAFDERIRYQINNLYAIQAFFHSSQNVDPDEFETFTQEVLRDNSSSTALYWAPRASEDIYLVRYVGGFRTPDLKENNNLSFDADLSECISQAIHTQTVYACPLIRTVIPGVDLRELRNFFILPVFKLEEEIEGRPHGGKTVEGLLISNNAVRTLVREGIRLVGLEGVQIEIEIEADNEKKPLHYSQQALDTSELMDTHTVTDKDAPVWVREFEVGGRKWKLTMKAISPQWMHPDWIPPFLVGFFSLCILVLMVFIMIIYLKRSVVIEEQVRSKTRDFDESVEIFRAISESAQDAVIMINNVGRIVFWNSSAEKIFGYSTEEVSGQNIHKLVAPERYHNQARQGLMGFHATGKGSVVGETVELTGKKKNGDEFPLELSVSSVKIKDIWHAIGLARDISDRKRSQKQVEYAQRMESIGRFAGGMAHDFNNQLMVISGYADFLLDELKEDAEKSAMASEIKKSSDKANELIKKMLAFGRKQNFTNVSLDLNPLLREMMPMIQSLLRKDIEFILEIPEESLIVSADASQLDQAILNLIINARDAMPEGGHLVLKVQDGAEGGVCSICGQRIHAENFISIFIQDSGTGIPEELQEKIFEPFYTTKPKGKGSGLGLSTCIGIIKQFKGHFRLESQEGKGTAMQLFLPKAQELPTDMKSADKKAIPGGSETILVVDDQDPVRHIVEKVLRDKGYRVYSATNGEEAIKVYLDTLKGEVDLIITDVIMPGMGGKQLSENLFRIRKDLRILFVSGFTEDLKLDYVPKEGFTEFLQKPLESGVLALKVRSMLDKV